MGFQCLEPAAYANFLFDITSSNFAENSTNDLKAAESPHLLCIPVSLLQVTAAQLYFLTTQFFAGSVSEHDWPRFVVFVFHAHVAFRTRPLQHHCEHLLQSRRFVHEKHSTRRCYAGSIYCIYIM